MTSCHRCASGRKLKEGIPPCVLPVVIFQKNSPSVCAWTYDACSRAWPDQWDLDRSGHRRGPPAWNNCSRPPATSQFGRRVRANPAAQSASDPKRPPVANRAGAASRHPRPAPEFLREHLPRNAAAKDEDDACQARAIRNAWSATLWPLWKNRQEGFDKVP